MGSVSSQREEDGGDRLHKEASSWNISNCKNSIREREGGEESMEVWKVPQARQRTWLSFRLQWRHPTACVRLPGQLWYNLLGGHTQGGPG